MSKKMKKIFKNIEAKIKPTAVVILLLVVCVSTMFIVNNSFVKPVRGAYTDFSYYKSLKIDDAQTPGALSNFPVLVKIDNDAGLYSNCQADGDDISFFDSTNTTQYSHQIERWNRDTGTSTVDLVAWVNVVSLAGSGDTIHMFYGNPTIDDQSNNPAVWDSNYKAVYHLTNDTSDSKNAHNSSFEDVNVSSAGIVGGCQDWEADSYNCIKMGSSADWNFGTAGAFSIECWVKFESIVASQELVGTMSTPTNTGWQGYIYTTGNPDVFEVWTGTGSSANIGIGEGVITTGVWYYFAYTRPASDTPVTLYIDGGSRGAVQTKTEDFNNDGNPLCLGADPFNSTSHDCYSPMDGLGDEFRISKDVARSANWIKTTYNMIKNQSSATPFITAGAEQSSESPSVYTLKGLQSNKITFSGVAGHIAWCNGSGDKNEYPEINLSVNSSDNVQGIKIWIGDTNTSAPKFYINASCFTLWVSRDNNSAHFGSLGAFTDLGSNKSINATTWNVGTMGASPFDGGGITDRDVSIYFRVSCSIPVTAPTNTFYSFPITACKVYIGHYT